MRPHSFTSSTQQTIEPVPQHHVCGTPLQPRPGSLPLTQPQQSDPLLAVQERPDGTNVNNWHWTERDVMGWSRNRLGELLGGQNLADTPEAGAKVTGVQELEGARPAGSRAYVQISEHPDVMLWGLSIAQVPQGQHSQREEHRELKYQQSLVLSRCHSTRSRQRPVAGFKMLWPPVGQSVHAELPPRSPRALRQATR